MQKNSFVYMYQTNPTRIWPHVDEGIAVRNSRQKIAGTLTEKKQDKTTKMSL